MAILIEAFRHVEGQKSQEFIFVTDDSDGGRDGKGKYAKLLSAYNTGVLSCSIILKREGRLGWWSNRRLCSSEVCFGGEEAKKSRKDEVAALARMRFWDKVRLRFTGSLNQKTEESVATK